MKNLMVLFLCLAFTNVSFAQKLKEYKATNGINYQIGDTITLGKGSAPNGDFNYLQMGGMYNTMTVLSGNYDEIGSGIGRNYSGLNVVIKKINQQKLKGAMKVYFVVGGGNITNYNLMIEEAIEACEIKDCKINESTITVIREDDKYDKLKKLKELYDSGILTEEEYTKEKEKLLKSE